MAGMTYRSIETGFWQDNFIISIPFKERAFYLYLLTNPRVSFCGIYELSINLVKTETGLPIADIEKLIDKFQNTYKRIVYSEKSGEIVLVNWLKHNPFNSGLASSTQRKGYENALAKVKDQSLIQWLSADTASVTYPIHTLSPRADIDIDLNTTKLESKNNEENIFKDYAQEDDALYHALTSFDAMRNEMKKPMTSRAKELLLKNLDGLKAKGENITACIEQSVFHNWQGVFAEKKDTMPGNKQQNGAIIPWLDDYVKNIQ